MAHAAPETSMKITIPPGDIFNIQWIRLTFYVLVFVLCLVTYHGVSDNYLFNDDFSWLYKARCEMMPGNLLTFRVVDFFRPLINVSFYLMERTSSGNIPLHYSFNLVFHFLNTVLVFHLVSALLQSRGTAAVTAVLFAVTSIHTGAVFWISARTTLVSVFFLLASLTVLASRIEKPFFKIALSTVLYVLALSAKETAIAGLPLAALIILLKNGHEWRQKQHMHILASFTAVSAAYLITRKAVMGGFFQANWGPGAHILRNAAGGFLYQLHPWPLLSIFYPAGTVIPEPGHPFLPEIIVLPLVILLLWAGLRTGNTFGFNLATGWALLSILPASLFRYRFFSTVSITQNRYYYLASVGSVLVITLLLSLLWNSRYRFRKIACAVLFILLCTGYILRVDRLENKWDHFTGMYRDTVRLILEETGRYPGITTLAIEDPPMAFPYIGHALALERPGLKAVEVTGGADRASDWKPCIYISYTGEFPKVMRIEKIE